MIVLEDKEFKTLIRETISECLQELIKNHELNGDKRLGKEYYCLAECARLKGVSAAMLRKNKHLQPLGGGGRYWIAGRQRWQKADVVRWLRQDDLTLERLYKKTNGGNCNGKS